MRQSYIPPRDVDLVGWSLNFVTVLVANPATYDSTSGAAAAIATLQGTFSDDFASDGTIDRKAVNPATRTKAGVAALRVAKAAMLAAIRPLAITISLDKTISDANKTAIGVTVRDTIKTHVPPPGTFPNLVPAPSGPLVTSVRYADSLTPTTKAKPPTVTGLQLFAVQSATVISDPATIPFIAFVTKQPYEFTWDSADRGKTVYFVGRWQNAKGEHGPFGPIVSAIIA